MLRTRNYRNAIKNAAVRYRLARQPLEGIAIALDLITVQATIDDSYVDPRNSMANTELPGRLNTLSGQPSCQSGSDRLVCG